MKGHIRECLNTLGYEGYDPSHHELIKHLNQKIDRYMTLQFDSGQAAVQHHELQILRDDCFLLIEVLVYKIYRRAYYGKLPVNEVEDILSEARDGILRALESNRITERQINIKFIETAIRNSYKSLRGKEPVVSPKLSIEDLKSLREQYDQSCQEASEEPSAGGFKKFIGRNTKKPLLSLDQPVIDREGKSKTLGELQESVDSLTSPDKIVEVNELLREFYKNIDQLWPDPEFQRKNSRFQPIHGYILIALTSEKQQNEISKEILEACPTRRALMNPAYQGK